MGEKSKDVQDLEVNWELLKLELEQKEDFYNRCSDCENEINVIHDIQSLISRLETGEYFE